MNHKPIRYKKRRFGLGTNCSLMRMPDTCVSYLLSIDNFLRHVHEPGRVVLTPWAEGELREQIEATVGGLFDWSREVEAFKVPTGVRTFIFSAFDEVNVPKLKLGEDTFSCWPSSGVRKALTSFGLDSEAPPVTDEQFHENVVAIDRRVDALWPGCVNVLLRYDHARAPSRVSKRLERLDGIATERLGWPMVQIESKPRSGAVWCHYSGAEKQAAWDVIVKLEGGHDA